MKHLRILPNSTSVDVKEIVTSLQYGVYVVKVTSGRGDVTERVVIE